MELVDIQEQDCKFGNGRNDSNKLGFEPGGGVGGNRLHEWHHSSRIIRVSRATGGKDRHSKVWTSKGLRDRRVRLSVGTAIQFYDLQDRLGFEQPSKAVEWLIEAASDAIAELPSLSGFFAEAGCGLGSPEMGDDGDEKTHQQKNQRPEISLARSACSSNASGLSLSRSEILVNRTKARDRARERTAKEKKQESRDDHSIPNNSSFTELLTGATTSAPENTVVESNLFDKSTAMDYCFASSSRLGHIQSTGILGQINDSASAENPHQDRLQHFSIVPDNLNDYNLNFTISAGLAGCNRGTLQSNISPSFLPYLQRFPHSDGSNVPFFIGAMPPATGPVQLENHHQLAPALFDGSWQLRYADGSHHLDQKGKGKN